ncbi:hypothetical protein DFH28DRAFT_1031697, partial [Melampsora americana]
MSRLAKLTLVGTAAITGMTVWGVHFLQLSEREAMYQGVLRDDERVRKRKEQILRDAEFEDQQQKQAYLQSIQPVTNPSGPIPLPKNDTLNHPIKLDGCKTC